MKHQIEIIPDSNLQNLDAPNAYRLVLRNEPPYRDNIIICPHRIENYSCITLFKFYLLCRRLKYRVTAVGSMCQLPLMSLMADEVVVEKNEKFFDKTYSDNEWKNRNYHGFCNNIVRRLSGFPIRISYGSRKYHRDKLAPIVIQAIEEVSTEEVVEYYTWQKICVLESAFREFQKLSDQGLLPHNVIWCEVKSDPVSTACGNVLEKLQVFDLPMFGLGHHSQKKIMKETNGGLNYMSLQILASHFNNCYFLGWRGSASLFALLPINSLVLMDGWIEEYEDNEHHDAVKMMNQIRYGNDNIPIIANRKRGLRDDAHREIVDALDIDRVNRHWLYHVINHSAEANEFMRSRPKITEIAFKDYGRMNSPPIGQDEELRANNSRGI